MKGLFGLDNTSDLLAKLEWEYSNLQSDKANPYLAYNFFVTGWHLLEWQYPSMANKSRREQIRNANIILEICEHIAVGAKHFEPKSKRHTSVVDTGESRFWAEGMFAPGFWAEVLWGTNLVVALTGEAAEQYGSQVTAVDLATHVMSYWKAELST